MKPESEEFAPRGVTVDELIDEVRQVRYECHLWRERAKAAEAIEAAGDDRVAAMESRIDELFRRMDAMQPGHLVHEGAKVVPDGLICTQCLARTEYSLIGSRCQREIDGEVCGGLVIPTVSAQTPPSQLRTIAHAMYPFPPLKLPSGDES